MTLMDTAVWAGKVFTGSWVDSSQGTYDVIEPATGAELAKLGMAGGDDVARSAERASEAHRAWAALPFEERAAVLRRAGDLFIQYQDEISEWIVREAGSIRPKAAFELHVAAQECYEAASLPSRAQGELLASPDPRQLSFSRRMSIGVVGVIAPFNVPLILAIRAVAPAIALGNAVVLKPDVRTAVAGGVAIARVFEEAGLPAGVLQVLPGGTEAGSALVAHPLVDVIAFTGSTQAGRAVGVAAAQHLKRAHLELGGNNALIVLDDADLDAATSAGAWASFFHQGQICMSAGRHLVHESVADDYAALLSEKASALRVGDPFRQDVQLGPIIDEKQRDRIHAIVTASLASGARARFGGEFDGLFYQPTVLQDVDATSAAFQQEIFGPVAPVVRFSTVEEAIRLARMSEYGLSLSVLSKDAMRAWDIAQQIPAGLVHINDQTVADQAHIPFGGVGDSGNGARIGSPAANVEAFTELQWVTMQRDIQRYPF